MVGGIQVAQEGRYHGPPQGLLDPSTLKPQSSPSCLALQHPKSSNHSPSPMARVGPKSTGRALLLCLWAIVAVHVFQWPKASGASFVRGNIGQSKAAWYHWRTPLGDKALDKEVPTSDKDSNDEIHWVRKMLSQISDVWGRREAFKDFADSLQPDDRKQHVEDIRQTLLFHAQKLWPECKVELRGSAAREVDNKYFSDVDFAITTRGKGITFYEVEDLCNCLMYHRNPEISMTQGSLGLKKAIELQVHGIKVDVAFPELFGEMFHNKTDVESWVSLYEEYPGARRAARIAKYVFQPLKGVDVEFVLNLIARNSRELWENRQHDEEGFLLFQELVSEIFVFPETGMRGPLQLLENKARTQRGNAAPQDMHTALSKCQVLAKSMFLSKDQVKHARHHGDEVKKMMIEVYLQEYRLRGQDKQQMSPDEEKKLQEALNFPEVTELSTGSKAKRRSKSGSTTAKDKRTGSSKGRSEAKPDEDGYASASILQKIIFVFDDMLYCLENYPVDKTRLEKKYIAGWCMGVDAWIEMATQTKKKQRWKKRRMPSSFHDVAKRTHDLGFDFANLMLMVISASDLDIPVKALLLGFLRFWKAGWRWGKPNWSVRLLKFTQKWMKCWAKPVPIAESQFVPESSLSRRARDTNQVLDVDLSMENKDLGNHAASCVISTKMKQVI